ncbi:MAG: hypothetical protein E7307_11420 [Butyrivibrio sp.]|nr:hypothetical protein [Butyrivibrio sp.]
MMRATRHNGRSGAHGTYNPKHNDREFDLDNAVDINKEMTPNNIYWNCYQGFTFHKDRPDDWMSFKDVELLFYKEQFTGWLDAQNERHRKEGHRKRIKTMEEVVMNKKWCPEETIYQIGNIDGTIDYKELAMVVTETMQEIDRRFGEYCRTMDWGLHIDEKTPHIHERHVFFAPDEYGFDMPQQEEACRRMGLELPDKESEPGRYNNRKMTFDKECRCIFLEKCKEHGIELEVEPIYGGKKYQEKQEFITSQINMKNQNVQIENGQLLIDNSILTETKSDLQGEIRDLEDEKLQKEMQLQDVNEFINDVTKIAYDKACETIIEDIADTVSREESKEISKLKAEITDSDNLITKALGKFAVEQLDKLQRRLSGIKSRVVNSLKRSFNSSAKKEQLLNKIADAARPSVLEILGRRKEAIAREDKAKALEVPSRKHKYEQCL